MLEDLKFKKKRHVVFFNRVLQILPNRYSVADSSRMTIAFFALSALDILDAIDSIHSKQDIINWIYSLQILPNKSGDNGKKCGFRGGASNGVTTHIGDIYTKNEIEHDYGHITMTYTAISSLIILGDNLDRLNRKACLESVEALQLSNGSFNSTIKGGEKDMRFVYCACCISTALDDFSAINVDKACSFIKASLTYDGGFAQCPNDESHGGSTYCACASLKLMGKFDEVLSEKEIKDLQHWCVHRQRVGFHGRANKDDDTCYSFWLGATLKMLNSFELIDFEMNKNFIMSTQDDVVGGFAKWPQVHPDVMHSYMGLCGLSLMNEFDLLSIDPAMNITNRAVRHMKVIHKRWKEEGDLFVNETGGVVKHPDKSSHPTFNFKTIILAIVIGLGPTIFPWCWNFICKNLRS